MFIIATFNHGDMHVSDKRYWKLDKSYGTEVIIYEAM